MVGGWVLDFTRFMLISTKVEVGVELGTNKHSIKVKAKSKKELYCNFGSKIV